MLQPPQQPPKLLALSLHKLFSYLLSDLQKSACFAPWALEALHRFMEFNASNKFIKEGIYFLHVALIKGCSSAMTQHGFDAQSQSRNEQTEIPPLLLSLLTQN